MKHIKALINDFQKKIFIMQSMYVYRIHITEADLVIMNITATSRIKFFKQGVSISGTQTTIFWPVHNNIPLFEIILRFMTSVRQAVCKKYKCVTSGFSVTCKLGNFIFRVNFSEHMRGKSQLNYASPWFGWTLRQSETLTVISICSVTDTFIDPFKVNCADFHLDFRDSRSTNVCRKNKPTVLIRKLRRKKRFAWVIVARGNCGQLLSDRLKLL